MLSASKTYLVIHLNKSLRPIRAGVRMLHRVSVALAKNANLRLQFDVRAPTKRSGFPQDQT